MPVSHVPKSGIACAKENCMEVLYHLQDWWIIGLLRGKIKVVLNRISGSGIGLRIIVFERIQIMLARLAASRHKAWELKSININENSRHCGYRILRYLEDETRFVFIFLCVFKSFVSSWTVIINPLANVFYRFQRHGCVWWKLPCA